MKAIVLLIVCWPSLLLAEPTFSATNEDGKLTLTYEPCNQHPWLMEWFAAHWSFRGKDYEACWTVQPTLNGGKRVVVLDSDGVMTPLPPEIFKKDEAV